VADTTARVAGLVLGEAALATTVATGLVAATVRLLTTLGAVAGNVTDLAALQQNNS
jgi:hypothetical protein